MPIKFEPNAAELRALNQAEDIAEKFEELKRKYAKLSEQRKRQLLKLDSLGVPRAVAAEALGLSMNRATQVRRAAKEGVDDGER